MARPPRIEYEGALYHVINRGIERRAIFSSASDCARFMRLAIALKDRYKVSLLAYCIMPNHYHLLLKTALANLHRYMKELDGGYSRRFNLYRARVGPLFQGRYRALLVEADSYVLGVARYIHMNPVKAGIVERPEEYRWSSYREYLHPSGSSGVDTDMILGFFHGSRGERAAQLRGSTEEMAPDEYDPDAAPGRVIAGAGAFLKAVRQDRISRNRDEKLARWRELQKPSAEVRASLVRRIAPLTDDRKLRAKLLTYALKKSTPLTLREIAGMTGMRTVVAVSQVVRRLEAAAKEDARLGRIVRELDRSLRADQ